jgi:uncharacterized peroxidase-related enzyme
VFLRSQDQREYASTAQALAIGALDDALLDPADRALLEYAKKLTLTPASMSDDDTSALHAAGWSDAQVWEATFTAAIFAMFNRMADAFGLQPPEASLRSLRRDP